MTELLQKLAQPWGVIGLIGQLLFGSRFVVQWIYSERRGKSLIPVSFWYLSLIGSLMLLSYAIYRADPVFILGFSANSIIYIRNLMLVRKEGQDKARTT